MTLQAFLLIVIACALASGAWWLGLREGYARGGRDADPQGAFDRGFNTGVVSGTRGGWRAAHEVALTALTKWPTSKGGKHVVRELAKGPAPRNADGAA